MGGPATLGLQLAHTGGGEGAARRGWDGGRQLAALYSEKLRVYATFHHVHMHMAFRALADAMTVMVTLDELMKQNPSFRGAFAPFKRCVRVLLPVPRTPEPPSISRVSHRRTLSSLGRISSEGQSAASP